MSGRSTQDTRTPQGHEKRHGTAEYATRHRHARHPAHTRPALPILGHAYMRGSSASTAAGCSCGSPFHTRGKAALKLIDPAQPRGTHTVTADPGRHLAEAQRYGLPKTRRPGREAPSPHCMHQTPLLAGMGRKAPWARARRCCTRNLASGGRALEIMNGKRPTRRDTAHR